MLITSVRAEAYVSKYAELKISPRTFYRWRAQGTGPRSKRMAKGGLRVRRSWLDEWLEEPERGIA